MFILQKYAFLDVSKEPAKYAIHMNSARRERSRRAATANLHELLF